MIILPCVIDLEIKTDDDISIDISNSDLIDIDVEVGSGGSLPYYMGPYEITPKARDAVVLDTSLKSMSEDVVIHEVPYSETTNPEGGKTINIAYVL